MNTTHAEEIKNNKQYKKEWTESSRHVPDRTGWEIGQLQSQRKKKYLQSVQETVGSAIGKKVYLESNIARRERKKNAREHYKERVEKRGPSTWSNPNFNKEMSPVQRLAAFNKHHKCSCHGQRFNLIYFKEGKFEFHCDRNMYVETIGDKKETRCLNCTNDTLYEVSKTSCLCDITLCMFCKLSIYKFEGVDKNLCHCFQRHRELDALKEREKMIKPKGKTWTSIKEKKDFFDEIKALVPKNKLKRGWETEIKAHGAMISTASTVSKIIMEPIIALKDKLKGIYKHYLDLALKHTEPVREKFTNLHVYQNALDKYQSIKRFLTSAKGLFMSIDFFAGVLEDVVIYFESNKFLMMPLLLSFYRLLFNPWSSSTLVELVNLSSMLAATFSVAKMKKMLDLFDNYVKIMGEVTVKYSVSQNPFEDDQVTFKAHGMEEFNFIPEFFSKLFQNVKGFSPKIFITAMQKFNVVYSFKRNVSDLLTKIAESFPNILKSFVKATDTKYFLRCEMRNKKSIFYQTTNAAVAINIAREHRLTDSEMSALSHIYKKLKTEMLEYIQVNSIPYDNDMIVFIKNLEQSACVRGMATDVSEPFIVRIVGDSGVGKSSLTSPLISAINPSLSAAEIATQTYNRNPNCDHWDGCTNHHKYCVYDDFNQVRDEKDLAELILIASKTPFMPEFASIDSADRDRTGMKGDIVAFEAVILHSNTTQIAPKTLNSSEAINRRKHVMYRLRFLPGFTKPELDLSHLRITKLDDQYEEMWSSTGEEGFRKMQLDVHLAYRSFKEKNQKLNLQIERLLFNPLIENEFKAKDIMQKAIASGEMSEVRKARMSRFVDAREEFETQGDGEVITISPHSGSDDGWQEIASDAISAIIYAGANTLHWIYVGVAFGLFLNYGNWIHKFLALVLFVTTFVSVFTMLRKYGATFAADSGEMKNKAHRVQLSANSGETIEIKADSELTTSLANNVVKITVHADGRNRSTVGVFIAGRTCLLNRHLFYSMQGDEEYVPEGSIIEIFDPRSTDCVTVKFEKNRLIEQKYIGDDHDITAYVFPVRVQARSNIINHFWDAKVNLKGRSIIRIDTDGRTHEFHHGVVTNDHIKAKVIYDQFGRESTAMTHYVIGVNIPSRPGLCGSLITVDDNLMEKKVVAINIGPTTLKDSAGLIVTSKIVKAIMEKAKEVDNISGVSRATIPADSQTGYDQTWTKPTREEIEKLDFGQSIVYAKSSYKSVPGNKTKIVESPVFDKIFQHTTLPCNLKGGQSKILEKMKAYGDPSLPFDKELIERAVKSIKEELSGIPTIRLFRTLTVQESINGVEEMPYLTSMDMTTSPGFPLVGMGMKGEKRQFFDGEAGCYTPKPLLQRQIDEILYRIDNDTLPDYPYTNTLKDERKDIEDVENGKVRMFSMSSCALAIVNRMYFLPVIAHYYQCRLNSFLTIGMDKTSREWDLMIRRFHEIAEMFGDADYKRFDTRANIEVSHEINKQLFIEDWMNERTRKQALILLTFDCQAMHQILEWIVLILSGTSSGSFMTSMRGSFINETYIRIAYMSLMKGTVFNQMMYYHRFVRTKNYGDDLVLVVHPTISHLFNCETIASFLDQYRITMTSGDKHSDFAFKSTYEFTYLRHTTGKLHNFYVPLAKDPMEQINWYRIGVNAETPEVACENNCNSALRASFFYGKEFFNKNRELILQVRPTYKLLEYGPLLDEFLDSGRMCDVEGTFTFGESRMSPQKMLENSYTHVEFHAHSGSEVVPSMTQRILPTGPKYVFSDIRQLFKRLCKVYIEHPYEGQALCEIDEMEEEFVGSRYHCEWYVGHFFDMLDENHCCKYCHRDMESTSQTYDPDEEIPSGPDYWEIYGSDSEEEEEEEETFSGVETMFEDIVSEEVEYPRAIEVPLAVIQALLNRNRVNQDLEPERDSRRG